MFTHTRRDDQAGLERDSHASHEEQDGGDIEANAVDQQLIVGWAAETHFDHSVLHQKSAPDVWRMGGFVGGGFRLRKGVWL